MTKGCEKSSFKKREEKKKGKKKARKVENPKRRLKPKMSVTVDRKPERAVQAKIRGIQKNIFPVD